MNLKAIQKGADGWPVGFAYLIDPPWPDVHSDEELYQAVRKHGRAVIRPFKKGTYELERPVVLSPSEFEKAWRGD